MRESPITREMRARSMAWSIAGKNCSRSHGSTHRNWRASRWQRSIAACVPFPSRLAKLSGEKRRSKAGSMPLSKAWWTTRSRNGAALMSRRFGSWMTKLT